MREVSNKTIVAFLMLALVLVVTTTFFGVNQLDNGLTGAAIGTGVGTGTTNLTVEGIVGISVTDDVIEFGSVYVNGSASYGVLDSNASHTGADMINTSTGTAVNIDDWHVIENNGTVAVNVTMSTDQTDARSYLCGTGNCPTTAGSDALVQVFATETGAEANTCSSGLQDSYATTLTQQTAENVTLCPRMEYGDSNDELRVYYRMQVPVDAAEGIKTLTTTYTAEAI